MIETGFHMIKSGLTRVQRLVGAWYNTGDPKWSTDSGALRTITGYCLRWVLQVGKRASKLGEQVYCGVLTIRMFNFLLYATCVWMRSLFMHRVEQPFQRGFSLLRWASMDLDSLGRGEQGKSPGRGPKLITWFEFRTLALQNTLFNWFAWSRGKVDTVDNTAWWAHAFVLPPRFAWNMVILLVSNLMQALMDKGLFHYWKCNICSITVTIPATSM